MYKKYAISEIGEIVSGATPKTSIATNFGGEIPWLTPADLSGYNEKYISHGARNLTRQGYNSCSAQLMPPGTVLLSSRAPIGYVAIAKNEICTNQGFKSIVPQKCVDSEFLYYQLKYLKRVLQDLGSGTTFKELSAKKLGTVQVVVPSIEEQRSIVAKIEELFSKLDASVAELQTAKEKLKVYRQAVLKEAFTPGKDWKKLKALDVGEVKLGRQRSPQNVSNLYPTKYIRAANITEQGLDLSDVLEMEFTPTEQSKYTLQENDIVISEASGSPTQVGKPALWKCELQTCCFQNTVIRHRVKEANPEYVFWYYKYLYISGYFSRIVGGVGINHLGAKNFSNIEIPIPSVLDQTKIVQRIERVLSVYGNIEQTIDTSLQQAEALRQSILKQAFEGGL